jgi:hypothetical protein
MAIGKQYFLALFIFYQTSTEEKRSSGHQIPCHISVDLQWYVPYPKQMI